MICVYDVALESSLTSLYLSGRRPTIDLDTDPILGQIRETIPLVRPRYSTSYIAHVFSPEVLSPWLNTAFEDSYRVPQKLTMSPILPL